MFISRVGLLEPMSSVDADVVVVGGGPAGLSAALYTQKNGLQTTLFDTDSTVMHRAHLFNYLGIGSINGSSFIQVARSQVDSFGVDRLQGEEVTSIEIVDDMFEVSTLDNTYRTNYVVLGTGNDHSLAESVGCETAGGSVEVNMDMETSIEDIYAIGSTVRCRKSQAIIAAGDGAVAAMDILSKEKGQYFRDFDVPKHAKKLLEIHSDGVE